MRIAAILFRSSSATSAVAAQFSICLNIEKMTGGPSDQTTAVRNISTLFRSWLAATAAVAQYLTRVSLPRGFLRGTSQTTRMMTTRMRMTTTAIRTALVGSRVLRTTPWALEAPRRGSLYFYYTQLLQSRRRMEARTDIIGRRAWLVATRSHRMIPGYGRGGSISSGRANSYDRGGY